MTFVLEGLVEYWLYSPEWESLKEIDQCNSNKYWWNFTVQQREEGGEGVSLSFGSLEEIFLEKVHRSMLIASQLIMNCQI